MIFPARFSQLARGSFRIWVVLAVLVLAYLAFHRAYQFSDEQRRYLARSGEQSAGERAQQCVDSVESGRQSQLAYEIDSFREFLRSSGGEAPPLVELEPLELRRVCAEGALDRAPRRPSLYRAGLEVALVWAFAMIIVPAAATALLLTLLATARWIWRGFAPPDGRDAVKAEMQAKHDAITQNKDR